MKVKAGIQTEQTQTRQKYEQCCRISIIIVSLFKLDSYFPTRWLPSSLCSEMSVSITNLTISFRVVVVKHFSFPINSTSDEQIMQFSSI